MEKKMSQNRRSGFFKPELETMSQEERIAYQNRRLKEIITHAYKYSPAIQSRMEQAGVKPEDIQSGSDLEKLPVIKKGELVDEQRKNLPFGGFCGLKKEELRRIYVSPGPIYEPGEKASSDYRWAQALYAMGFRAGDIGQITFNFSMVPAGFWFDEALQQLGCISVPTGVGNTELQIQIMEELEVTAYLGTPSFLVTLAERAEKMGLDLRRDLKLEVGFVAAEPLPESLRTELEERFDMIVRQAYGTADVGCLSYECIEKSGMHYPDDCIVEILDPQTGKRLRPNETGEVVATVFDKSYPLVRFGTGDLSYYTDEPCPCGRTSFRLVKIVGRADQVTKVKGMFVHPSQVDEVGKKFPSLGNCQVVVLREANQDRMIFRAELLSQDVDEEALKQEVAQMVQEVLRLKGEVEFLPSGSIPAEAKKVDDQRKWD
jgi:phenylacetate-CoA ligase